MVCKQGFWGKFCGPILLLMAYLLMFVGFAYFWFDFYDSTLVLLRFREIRFLSMLCVGIPLLGISAKINKDRIGSKSLWSLLVTCSLIAIVCLVAIIVIFILIFVGYFFLSI